MTLSAIVPVWNGRDLLARLLDTLAAQTLRPSEILIVDNGSTDGAPDLARARGARVIGMGRNAGFAAAVNRGIGEARSEWLAVLNSDVELAPDYFARLVAACLPPAAFATGKILDARRNGLLDGAFDLTARGGATWRAGNGRPDGPAWSVPRLVSSPPWTAVLFRADLFGRAGPLDERFESYLEDVEFGLRSASLGLCGWYVPEAVAWHRGSASLGRWHSQTVRRITRNQLYIAARHLPRAACWPVLVCQFLWAGLAVRHAAPMAWLRGMAEGLRAFPAMRREFRADAALPARLRANEFVLRELQGSDPDLFWRLYFRLTQGGTK